MRVDPVSLPERLDAALSMLRVALIVTAGTVTVAALATVITRLIEGPATRPDREGQP